MPKIPFTVVRDAPTEFVYHKRFKLRENFARTPQQKGLRFLLVPWNLPTGLIEQNRLLINAIEEHETAVSMPACYGKDLVHQAFPQEERILSCALNMPTWYQQRFARSAPVVGYNETMDQDGEAYTIGWFLRGFRKCWYFWDKERTEKVRKGDAPREGAVLQKAGFPDSIKSGDMGARVQEKLAQVRPGTNTPKYAIQGAQGSAAEYPYAAVAVHDPDASGSRESVPGQILLEMSVGVNPFDRGVNAVGYNSSQEHPAGQRQEQRFISRYWPFSFEQWAHERDHTSVASSDPKMHGISIPLHCAALLAFGRPSFYVDPDRFMAMKNAIKDFTGIERTAGEWTQQKFLENCREVVEEDTPLIAVEKHSENVSNELLRGATREFMEPSRSIATPTRPSTNYENSYDVGEKVQRRDAGNPSRDGFVTQLAPEPRVTLSSTSYQAPAASASFRIGEMVKYRSELSDQRWSYGEVTDVGPPLKVSIRLGGPGFEMAAVQKISYEVGEIVEFKLREEDSWDYVYVISVNPFVKVRTWSRTYTIAHWSPGQVRPITYALGQEVWRRNEQKEWGQGLVTSTDPLEVSVHDKGDIGTLSGLRWTYVCPTHLSGHTSDYHITSHTWNFIRNSKPENGEWARPQFKFA